MIGWENEGRKTFKVNTNSSNEIELNESKVVASIPALNVKKRKKIIIHKWFCQNFGGFQILSNIQ